MTMFAIDGNRLNRRLAEFAEIGALPKGGVNRQALTEGDRQARRMLAGLALARGFRVFQDPMANLFIRRPGRDETLAPLMIGSHLDSQPAGGRYDGALGTLSAFEVLESLEDAGTQTDRPVEVVAWTNEEGCRFAPGCMGSMAFADGAIPEEWAEKQATDGASFTQELAATIASLPEAEMRPLGFPVYSYIEIHIEQGPSLEAENIPIGVVTGIQGTRWLEVTVTGQTAHAGTTGLSYRRDPMRALSAALSGLYDTIMPEDENARFTVGSLRLSPGSVNAIPEEVRCTVDIRHPDPDSLDALEAKISAAFSKEAGRQGCTAAIRRLFDMAPCVFDEGLQDRIEEAAASLQMPSRRMLSGAFHDALFANRVAPAAMIFVPCRDGLSHNEAEFVEPADAIAGCRVMMQAVRMLTASEGT